MRSSEEALIATIAGLRTPAKDVTLPTKSLILKTEGPEALLDEVFGLGLLDPRKEAALVEAESDLHKWQSAGYEIIPIYDERYPRQLWQVHQAPGLIFSSGTVQPDDRAVSVVGSRNAGAAALQAARDVSQQLVSQGITVVSGLAKGIDTAAHEAALDFGERTVAVMGTGLDQTYPAENHDLRKRIEQTGQIITQFFPSSKAAKYNFPMRNATMSGYGIATVVIAAGESSGTKHQAKAAIGHGRALILTPEVASTTSWGRDYVDHGDALVAASPEEAAQLALEVIETNRAINELVS